MLNLNEKPTILQKIVQDKLQWLSQKERDFPLEKFKQKILKSDRSFYQALSKGTHKRPAFILECKKASPSKGLIRENFDLTNIANVYKNYASAISVLTDEKYFQGDFSYISQVRDIVTQPILCKDFIVSKYQIYLARLYKADAILLMLSVIDDNTYRQLADLAHSLNMGVLTEISNQTELQRAIALNAKVIGINNRDLRDMSVNLDRTPPFAIQIPSDRIIISESGIYHHAEVKQLKTYVHGFLIGGSLMESYDLNNSIRAIIFGENKVCGLTRPQDVRKAYAKGALYGGLIFAETSPRQLSLRQAQELVTQAPLRFVAVFQNQPIEFIVKIATQLKLFAIQLHGSESAEFITSLRQQLPPTCQIWKTISVQNDDKSAVQIEKNLMIDRYVFDTKTKHQQGGTGLTFDWSLIPTKLKTKVMLAGGLNLENIDIALNQACLGLDLNSGVESNVGVKDEKKLNDIFSKILDN
ncbi:bifunctional indole-3-glycerol-phosphate synthase TrpC/phosphoribosylanthranilate isomerase TrpF [Seminibacterium arietis]|uniref:Multifunctional fusion protein n=1 Tax=Seminibacterium arietis TaxID=1173502 RepID=A0ABW3I788_9PAST